MATKSDDNDPEVLKATFPNAAESLAFSHPPFDKLKDECLIVLDASVLLLPYESDLGEGGFAELMGIYKKLADKGRLLVPAQAIREFVKRRGTKICELVQTLDKFQIASVPDKSFPLQESFDQLKRFAELREEANKKIKECRQTLAAAIDQVQQWNWDDPVSEAYRQVFKGSVIYEPKCENIDIAKESKRRFDNRVPPGYMDGGKAGDFLIWQSLKEVAQERQCAAAFVTKETKEDWVSHTVRSGTYTPAVPYLLLPRFELIDEFRREAGGKSFFILKLDSLLRAFKASEKLIAKVDQSERDEVPFFDPRELLGAFLAAQDTWYQFMSVAAKATLDTSVRAAIEAGQQGLEGGVDLIRRVSRHCPRTSNWQEMQYVLGEMCVLARQNTDLASSKAFWEAGERLFGYLNGIILRLIDEIAQNR